MLLFFDLMASDNLAAMPPSSIASAIVASAASLESRDSDVEQETAANIEIEIVNGVAWLRYARPPVNAFTQAMVAEVRTALMRLMDDPAVRVIVLASAVERYFSAGADLQEFVGIGREGMRQWGHNCQEIARLLRRSPKPLLAAINGTAVGGGLEMTLHCDLRFAGEGARLGQPEIKIAFIPPIATTQALVRLIGRPRTIRYLYDGALHEAGEALEMGLVDEVVPDDALAGHVQAYAETLAGKPAAALAAIRRTVTLGGGMTFEDGLAYELETVAELAATADFDEGVAAFLAKRAPRWQRDG